jgi:hypothetical protein
MAKYPTRPSHYAHKYTRLLGKTCAAQKIGTDAMALVIHVVHTEDATRYTRPITFHTGQLLPILGFGKWDRLDRARRKAVEHGWLHYEPPPSGFHAPGTYWTEIPPGLEDVDDTPIDEGLATETIAYMQGYADGHRDGATGQPPKTFPVTGDGAVYGAVYGEGEGEGYGEGELPTLPLNPSPNPKSSRPKLCFSEDDLATAKWMFGKIEKLLPNTKPPDFESWGNSIRLIRELDKRTDDEIRELFSWANAHHFWHTTVRCPDKLRKQWDTLWLQRKADNGSKGTGRSGQRGGSDGGVQSRRDAARTSKRKDWEKLGHNAPSSVADDPAE